MVEIVLTLLWVVFFHFLDVFFSYPVKHPIKTLKIKNKNSEIKCFLLGMWYKNVNYTRVGGQTKLQQKYTQNNQTQNIIYTHTRNRLRITIRIKSLRLSPGGRIYNTLG